VVGEIAKKARCTGRYVLGIIVKKASCTGRLGYLQRKHVALAVMRSGCVVIEMHGMPPSRRGVSSGKLNSKHAIHVLHNT